MEQYFDTLMQFEDYKRKCEEKLIVDYEEIDKEYNLIKDEVKDSLDKYIQYKKNFEKLITSKQFKFSDKILEKIAQKTQNDLITRYFASSKQILHQTNQHFNRMNLLKEKKKTNDFRLFEQFHNEKGIQAFPTVKIPKNIVEAIDITKRQDQVKDNSKIIGADLLKKFHFHFANLLWKNYSIYLFKKRLGLFIKKIKTCKALMRRMSIIFLRNLGHQVIERIIKIQNEVKFYQKAQNIKKLFPKVQIILKYRKRSGLKFLLFSLHYLKAYRSQMKKKVLRNTRPVFFQKAMAKYKSVLVNENNALLAGKTYYETKLRWKIFLLLFHQIRDI